MDSPERQASDPQQLAADFLHQFQQTGEVDRELIADLAQLAASDNAVEAQAATTAIFASLVEKLADAFEPACVLLYNRLFAQLIHLCRATPQGASLDQELTRLGVTTEAALVSRAEQLRYIRRFTRSAAEKERIKRAIVLSRVTIGADVVITSIIIERLKREFPNAEIALVGNRKAAELFGGEPRITFTGIDYQRGGTLTTRLASWLEVLAQVRELTEGLNADEWLMVDPDSRLTQLGLLPLLPVENLYQSNNAKAQLNDPYLFFPSRELGAHSGSLSELTSIWLNAVFSGEAQTFPQLYLRQQDYQLAQGVIDKIRQGDSRPLVSLNFGVGENAKKRISDNFESHLVARLLQSGARLILDKGAGAEELQRAERIIALAAKSNYRSQNLSVIEANEENLQTLVSAETLAADLLVWQGRIGLLAALIATSDLYIGYDSAGQHIAAALAVPCIDIFAGYSSPRMLQRWRPTGRSKTHIINVDTLHSEADSNVILEQTLQYAQEHLAKR